jgi:hypothetical protein
VPEGLSTEDGQAIDLDAAERDFARAMAAPEPDEPEAPAPPKRQELTEEELGAKYGWTTGPNGERRAKRAKGRPRTQARLTEAPPQASEKPGKPPKSQGVNQIPKSLLQPLSELTSAVWMLCAAIPIPAEPLRVKVRAQAAILKANQVGLVQGVDMMARHNGVIRRGVEMLTMGSAGWVLPATMAVAPFCAQSAQLWRMDPAQLVGLAQQTEDEWAEQFAAMQQAMGLADPEPEEEPGEEAMAA